MPVKFLVHSSLLCLLILTPLLCFGQSSPTSSPVRIVVLGDSIADGYGISLENAYPAKLEELLKVKGKNVSIVNAGVSGSTTASALGRLKWQLKLKIDILVLELGGNDGLRGVSVESSKKNLDETIRLAKSNGIKVVLTGMKLPVNYGKKYRQDFERIFVQLEKEHQITLLPFLLEGVGGKDEFNQSDGIHPNEKGHQKIAENLLPYIEKHL